MLVNNLTTESSWTVEMDNNKGRLLAGIEKILSIMELGIANIERRRFLEKDKMKGRENRRKGTGKKKKTEAFKKFKKACM